MAAENKGGVYDESSIKSLDPLEHIRIRPGMYIGKLGDGSSPEDGIYILLKEVIDNSIDEFMMGAGKTIEVTVTQHKVRVRDYGRGIPLGKVLRDQAQSVLRMEEELQARIKGQDHALSIVSEVMK